LLITVFNSSGIKRWLFGQVKPCPLLVQPLPNTVLYFV